MNGPNPAYGAHLLAYAGIPTFLRQPASRELEGVDVTIVGIPFDSGATSFRSGARLGPRRIREASSNMWGYHRTLHVAPLKVLNVVDYGDVTVEPTSIELTMGSIASEVATVLSKATKVVALGGDHSITLALLRAHAARFGPLALVQFDAHSDAWPGKVDHGTFFRYAAQEGLLDAQACVQVGIRGSLCEADDLEAASRLGAQVLTVDACFEMGIPAVVRAIRETVGERQVYVSLDMDSVDPAYAPGVGTPEVGGFSSYQMLQLVRGLQGLNLVGMDLVEVCPPYDSGEITSLLAATLAFDFLSLLAAAQMALA
jgi:agmatinase